MSTINTGKDAEARACGYLQEQGLQLVQRNYHSRRGEIDLIMQDKDSLVFVEVRYRRQSRFGSAAESVNRHKQSKLLACANHYIQAHPELARQACRFDVVSIDGNMNSIDWIKNAFDAWN
jgi:putative endonuclease